MGLKVGDEIGLFVKAANVLPVTMESAGPVAVGANKGLAWIKAYTLLQQPLAEAVSGVEIRVAGAVYKTTTRADRMATFTLSSGLAIYGGFAGNQAYLHERDWHSYPTVLRGDIGTARGILWPLIEKVIRVRSRRRRGRTGEALCARQAGTPRAIENLTT